MKYFAIIALFLAVFVNDLTAQQSTEKITIDGYYTSPPKEDETLYLYLMTGPKTKVKVDSTTLKDKHFSFVLDNRKPDKYLLENTLKQSLTVYLDYGSTHIAIDSTLSKAKITGNNLDTLIKTYNGANQIVAFAQLGYAFSAKKYKNEGIEVPDSIKSQFTETYKKLLDNKKDITHKLGSRNDLVAAYVLSNGGDREFTTKQLNDFYTKMSSSIKETTFVFEFKKLLDKLNNLEVGVKAPDFNEPDTHDKNIQLSEFIKGNKLTLVDFWASWCGPCRAENPNVLQLYKEYQDKGFAIIGVSIDKKKEDWLKAIEDDQLIWKNVMVQTNNESNAADLYNITAVPTTILIDSQGNICAKNLRGEELRNKVAEICD